MSRVKQGNGRKESFPWSLKQYCLRKQIYKFIKHLLFLLNFHFLLLDFLLLAQHKKPCYCILKFLNAFSGCFFKKNICGAACK